MNPATIDKIYPPKYFNETPVNNVLLSKERTIALVPKKKANNAIYETFNSMFDTFLSKIPNNNVKKYVTMIFNKKLIFIGLPASARNDAVFTRVCMDGSKLSALVLDASILDISLTSGETSSIDDCIYASYFGLIRAVVCSAPSEIRKAIDLHKLVCVYIFNILLRAIGNRLVYTETQKALIHIASIYAFYRHFFNEKHPATLSIIKREYGKFFKDEYLETGLKGLETCSNYASLQDIPKILIDLKVFYGQPSQINMSLLNILNVNYHNFVGPLDTLIALICTAKYPSSLIPKGAVILDKVHDGIEQLMGGYINKLEYSPSKLFG